MNISYLKYAVEVARCGMLNKAAQNLKIAPSNLSRNIKDLEGEIGIKIFERTPKGVTLTAEGNEFIRQAKSLLRQMTDIENLYKNRSDQSVTFSVSVPRASYVCEALVELNILLKDTPVKLYYKESNSIRTIESVMECSCDLGIIRSEKRYDKYFFDYIASKGIVSMPIGEYRYRVTTGCNSVIAGLDSVTFEDLRPLTQIAFADPYVPYISTDVVLESETMSGTKRNIFVVEAMSACHMLLEDPTTFMWRSPMSKRILDKSGLAQKECIDHNALHSDILIWRRNYKFSETDKYFIEAVKRKAEECGMNVR